ncbi:MAG: protein translocase subunit SecF [bacterium]
MLQIIHNRRWYYSFSALLIILSAVGLFSWGLRYGIDFTGGSLIQVKFLKSQPATVQEVADSLSDLKFGDIRVQAAGDGSYHIRTRSLTSLEHDQSLRALAEKFSGLSPDLASTIKTEEAVEELSFESIGPVIGEELRVKTWWAIAVVLLAIILYIAFAFRHVSHPVASWKYGLSAVLALAHDAFISAGVFAYFGHFFGAEADSLFVTALLTIIGFSVHDTIVVFDRIRENLKQRAGSSFIETINHSVNETLVRSINTSLTAMLVLAALAIFGGVSIKWFAIVLLIGIAIGTYSSIFIASPLLVFWSKHQKD